MLQQQQQPPHYFPPPVVGHMAAGGGGGGGLGGSGGLGLQEDLRAMAGVAALEGPQLALVRQTSSVVERVSRNGLQKNVHVVVKACPFALHIALAQPPRPASATDAPPPLSLKWLALEASLVYDSEALKPVSFVKTKPIEYKPVVNESGDQVTLNMKIKVLTSQHEDMFFRVRVVALQQKTRQPLVPPLELVSEPIKVISKPKQSKKKTQSKKRSLNDLLIEAVHRIELHQRRQHRLVDHLLKRRRLNPDAAAAAAGSLLMPPLGDSSSPEPLPLSHSHPFPLPSSSSSSSLSLSSSVPPAPSPSLSLPSPSLAFSSGSGNGSPFGVPSPTSLMMGAGFHAALHAQQHPRLPSPPRSLQIRSSGSNDDDEAEEEDDDDEDSDGSACLARSMSSELHGHHHHHHHHHAYGQQDAASDPSLMHPTTTTTTTTSSSTAAEPPVDELEQGLEQFLAVYARLPFEERAARIRRFMRRASSQDAERVGGFFTCAVTALNPLKQVKKEPSDHNPSEGCACVVCPHQQELARIDQFYKDFLTVDFPVFGSS